MNKKKYWINFFIVLLGSLMLGFILLTGGMTVEFVCLITVICYAIGWFSLIFDEIKDQLVEAICNERNDTKGIRDRKR